MVDAAPAPPPNDGAASASPPDANIPTYRPHRMERYCAQHLLQNHFEPNAAGASSANSSSDTSPADFSHVTTATLPDHHLHSVHVPGRIAVPFLTTSGVSRAILKQIWTVVDPDGVGTLVRRSQFHAMLRLVALEEAGLLPPLPADGAGEVLTDALVRYAHLDIPLPTFDAVRMPTAAFLVGTYADAVRGQDQDETTTDGAGAHHVWEQAQEPSLMSAQYRQQQMHASPMQMQAQMPAGGMSNRMPMPSPMQPPQMQMQMGGGGGLQQQQQQQQMASSSSNLGSPPPAPRVVMSVDDAFADLGPAEDRVLPSDDFGDFEEAGFEETGADDDDDDDEEDEAEEDAVNINDDDNDGAAAAVGDVGEVVGGGDPSVVSPPGGEEGDDMAGAPPMGTDDAAAGSTGSADVPPPPLPPGPPPPPPPHVPPMDGAQPPEEEEDDDDDGFGDFEEGMDDDNDGGDEAPASASAGNTDADSAPDFGAAVAPTVPPPSLPPPAVPSEFTAPDTTTTDVAADGLCELGTGASGFGGQTALVDPSSSASDPFATLGPSSDAPLPAEPFGATEPPTAHDNEAVDTDEDDDFGDFGAAEGGDHTTDNEINLEQTPLDAVGEPTMVPAQPPTDVDDSFGGFEGQSQPPPATSVDQQTSDDPGDDPFSALGPAADAPLPAEPSGAPELPVVNTASVPITVEENADVDDAGDFGTFETTQASDADDVPALPSDPSTEAAASLPDIPPPPPLAPIDAEGETTTPDDDPFSVLGPAADAPLPVFSVDSAELSPGEAVADATEEGNASEDDDFGSFEKVETNEAGDAVSSDLAAAQFPDNEEAQAFGTDVETMDVPPPAPPQEPVGEESSDDPFALLGPSADAPLPVLSYGSAEAEVSPEVIADVSDDDDFGDFEEIPAEGDAPAGTDGEITDSEDIVGDTKEVDGPTESMPTATAGGADDSDNDDDDGFGDFGTSETEAPIPLDGNEAAPVQDTLSPAFGVFGPPTCDEPTPTGEPTPVLQESTPDAGTFDVFGPSADVPTPNLDDPSATAVGTFDAFTPNNEESGPTDTTEPTGDVPESVRFDAFASADASPAATDVHQDDEDDDDDDDDDGFGAFADNQDTAPDDFGESPITHNAPEEPASEGFSDFSAPTTASTAPQEANDQFDAFTSGAGFPDADTGTSAPILDEEPEFDAFASSAPTPLEEEKAVSSQEDDGDDDDDFGDWGAFGGEKDQRTPTSDFPEGQSEMEEIKGKVSALGGKLDAVHFEGLSVLECIDAGANRDIRCATRSYFVYHMLSSSHIGNAAAWTKLIEATKIELATCKSLLQEMAKGLARKDRIAVSKSDKLQVFLEGLRECVRVVRSIAATLADLQCLPDDIDLANLDGWRKISILEEAFVVETQWAQMLRAVKKLGIKIDLTLESIPDLRKRTSNLHVDHTDAENYTKMVCNLTLQPLVDTVDWNGCAYTACAANLYANRVSEVAPLL